MPRRNVVVLDNCNKCHDRLATTFSHGGQRIAIEECDMCHNPNASDKARRPADQGPPESIAFKRLIHRIHTRREPDAGLHGLRLQRRRATSTRSAIRATARTACSATRARRRTTCRCPTARSPVQHAARLLLAAGTRHGRVPGLPRQRGRRRSRVPEHGDFPRRDELRRGVRDLPRTREGLGRRQGPRQVVVTSRGGRAAAAPTASVGEGKGIQWR